MRQSHHLFTSFLLSVLAFASAFLPSVKNRHHSLISSAFRTELHLELSNNRYHSTVISSATKAIIMELKRGNGGRIEDAFAAAKAKNEAAFVSFVTAGYPTAQGTHVRWPF